MNITHIWRNASAVFLSALGLGLLSVSCFAMVFAGNTFFDSIDNGSGLKEIYSFGIVLLEIAAWILWGASAALWNKKYQLLAILTFLSAFAWETYSGAVHYNYFHASIIQSAKNSEVDLTVGQEYRQAKMASLTNEMALLDKPFESPDFGAASIQETIRSVQASASASIRQGSTTNGDRIIEKLTSLQEKLADAESRRAQHSLDEQRRREDRKQAIRVELDSMQTQVEQVAKGGGMTKGLDEQSSSVMAFWGAFLLKLMAMLCSIVPGYIWSSRLGEASARPAAPMSPIPAATAPAPQVASNTPKAVAEEALEPESRQVACAVPMKRDERLRDLLIESPLVQAVAPQEAPEAVVEPEAVAEVGEIAEATPVEPVEQSGMSVEAVVSGLPETYRPFYRALLAYAKSSHPRAEALPAKGIAALANMSLSTSRMGEVYRHAQSVGLLSQAFKGQPWYVTNKIDELVI